MHFSRIHRYLLRFWFWRRQDDDGSSSWTTKKQSCNTACGRASECPKLSPNIALKLAGRWNRPSYSSLFPSLSGNILINSNWNSTPKPLERPHDFLARATNSILRVKVGRWVPKQNVDWEFRWGWLHWRFKEHSRDWGVKSSYIDLAIFECFVDVCLYLSYAGTTYSDTHM